MGMGIDREKLGYEIRRREGECGDGEMVNTNTNGLFRNQGSISYGHRSFQETIYTIQRIILRILDTTIDLRPRLEMTLSLADLLPLCFVPSLHRAPPLRLIVLLQLCAAYSSLYRYYAVTPACACSDCRAIISCDSLHVSRKIFCRGNGDLHQPPIWP